MKRLLTAAGAAVALSIVSQAAMAQSPAPGPYISGGLGLSIPRDIQLKGTGVNTTAERDNGFALQGAIGNAFDNGFRAELEANYHHNGIDKIGGIDATGNSSGFGLMLNGLYDFKTGTDWTPYLGAGIGLAKVSASGASPVGATSIDDSDWGFGYQGIAGITYKLDDQAGIFAEYRYTGTSGITLKANSGADLNGDGGDHRIMVGLRWSFGAPKPMPKPMPVSEPAPPAPAPKPAPAPAPAPEIVKRYLVFFDWDKSALTADAKAIVAQAAANSHKVTLTRIEATGHADRSGPDAYNMGLSKRRAEAVRAELIRQGIPAKEIVIHWKGEREPLVQTPDGVREPQNRRVEIVFN